MFKSGKLWLVIVLFIVIAATQVSASLVYQVEAWLYWYDSYQGSNRVVTFSCGASGQSAPAADQITVTASGPPGTKGNTCYNATACFTQTNWKQVTIPPGGQYSATCNADAYFRDEAENFWDYDSYQKTWYN